MFHNKKEGGANKNAENYEPCLILEFSLTIDELGMHPPNSHGMEVIVYISETVVVGMKDGMKMVYATEQNSILLVSEDLAKIMSNLWYKYPNSPIDLEDCDLTAIQHSGCYEVLVRHRFLTDTPEKFLQKYCATSATINLAYLHISQECNLRCNYCYAKENLGKNMIMSLENAKSYIDKLVVRGLQRVALTGGEPLLNESINLIVKYIKKQPNIKISLLTNGMLLEKWLPLLDMIDTVIVSLDIPSSTSRIGLDYSKVVNTLFSLKDDLKGKVAVRSVISRGEEAEVGPMKAFVENMGLRYMVVPRLPNSSDDLSELPNLDLLSAALDVEGMCNPSKCGAGTSVVSIDWNGDLYPCQSLMDYQHRVGTMQSDNWYELLASSQIVANLTNSNVSNLDRCRECKVKYLCGGGCRALAQKVYNGVDKRVDFLCEYMMKSCYSRLSKVSFQKR